MSANFSDAIALLANKITQMEKWSSGWDEEILNLTQTYEAEKKRLSAQQTECKQKLDSYKTALKKLDAAQNKKESV